MNSLKVGVNKNDYKRIYGYKINYKRIKFV